MRFRHRLMLEVRNATMDELNENQLGLIQRRILATSIEIWEEPILLGSFPGLKGYRRVTSSCPFYVLPFLSDRHLTKVRRTYTHGCQDNERSHFRCYRQANEAKPAANRAADNAARLLEEAEIALHGIEPAGAGAKPKPFQLEELIGSGGPPEKCSIDLLSDVDLDLKIELGRTHMQLEEVLKLRRGSVITLDKLPVTGGYLRQWRMVARGEVLVLNDNSVCAWHSCLFRCYWG